MSNGEIVEQGTHDDLVGREGAYWRLVRAQDLGRGRNEESDGETEGKLDHVVLEESGSGPGVQPGESNSAVCEVGEQPINLISCIGIIMREQKCLWVTFLAVAICCIAGGKNPRQGLAIEADS